MLFSRSKTSTTSTLSLTWTGSGRKWSQRRVRKDDSLQRGVHLTFFFFWISPFCWYVVMCRRTLLSIGTLSLMLDSWLTDTLSLAKDTRSHCLVAFKSKNEHLTVFGAQKGVVHLQIGILFHFSPNGREGSFNDSGPHSGPHTGKSRVSRGSHAWLSVPSCCSLQSGHLFCSVTRRNGSWFKGGGIVS